MEVVKNLSNMKNCPIEVTLEIVGKKWSINIIRDLFKGKTRFSEFLESNPQLSTKMLSERLKELQKFNVIKKTVSPTTPVTIEYALTTTGKNLNKVLFHLAEFSLKNYPDNVYDKEAKLTDRDISNLRKVFKVN